MSETTFPVTERANGVGNYYTRDNKLISSCEYSLEFTEKGSTFISELADKAPLCGNGILFNSGDPLILYLGISFLVLVMADKRKVVFRITNVDEEGRAEVECLTRSFMEFSEVSDGSAF